MVVPNMADNHHDDPLSRAMRPPKNETAEQRACRVREEQEAIRVSQDIDRELQKERFESKKRDTEIKILLLGPSGSGKSTTLKNFQLAFAPKAFQTEIENHTAFVYLNVASSVRLLCDMLLEETKYETEFPGFPLLQKRCSSLRSIANVEADLVRGFCEHPQLDTPYPYPYRGVSNVQEAGSNSYEITLTASCLRRRSNDTTCTTLLAGTILEKARTILARYREDIEAVANHSHMRQLMERRVRKLQYTPGYFLGHLSRICHPAYIPTEDDILRTRIRTLGASETRIKLESGPDKGTTMVVYDVGGSQCQRARWVPYFDDVNTIIFIAPIGHFDQYLEEDPTTNCLRDSLEIWSSIVSSKLLEKTNIILFLNKYDILDQKLKSGIQFSKFVTSYKDVNDAASVGRYLMKKFVGIHKQRSPNPSRTLYPHFTSVTDRSNTVALVSQCMFHLHGRDVLTKNYSQATFLA